MDLDEFEVEVHTLFQNSNLCQKVHLEWIANFEVLGIGIDTILGVYLGWLV